MHMYGRCMRTRPLRHCLSGWATRPAAIESQRAATERIDYVRTATEHPGWSVDVSFGLMRGQEAGVRGAIIGLDHDR